MAKTIKFNLRCDGRPVRTIAELQENFVIDDMLAYYHSGLLAKWLEVRGFASELAQVQALTAQDDLAIVTELVKIFQVESDQEKIAASVHVLQYHAEREKMLATYDSKNGAAKKIIADYQQGYTKLVNDMLENLDNAARLKATIRALMRDYRWAMDMNHRALFYQLYNKKNGVLALMCLLMHEEARRYYLPQPIKVRQSDGRLATELDIAHDTIKKDMYDCLLNMIWEVRSYKGNIVGNASQKFIRALGDEEKKFFRIASPFDNTRSITRTNYWANIEPKGKQYMIISMADGDYVRPVGGSDRGLDYRDIVGQFRIIDGIDYKPSIASHHILYMEV